MSNQIRLHALNPAEESKICLCQYPSVYSFCTGPKILLLSDTEQWIDDFIHHITSIWESDLLLSYIPKDEEKFFDLEQLSWIHLNAIQADYIVGYIDNISDTTYKNVALLGPWLKEQKTYIQFNDLSLSAGYAKKIFSLYSNKLFDNQATLVQQLNSHWQLNK